MGEEQNAEKARCLVLILHTQTECWHTATGTVYDESDQADVPSCEFHIKATAQGRCHDYRPSNPPVSMPEDVQP